ncbi:C2H2-type domain-containing protein [Aphelenchoides besseyi]|nr:C2H2-type domain-containing protein [Aphelenchoides besseyi]
MAATLIRNGKPEDPQKFTCVHCNAAFTRLETLRNHMSYYCVKKINETNNADKTTDLTATRLPTLNPSIATSTSATDLTSLIGYYAALTQRKQPQKPEVRSVQEPKLPSLPSTSLLETGNMCGVTNTIILPVGYHQSVDSNVIQVVGAPQTVIPVAISKNLSISTRPLLLDGSLTNQLQLPGRLTLNPLPNEFGLPLAFIQPLSLLNNGVTTVSSNANKTTGMNANPLVTSAMQLNGRTNRNPISLVATRSPVNEQQPLSARATATIIASTALSPSIITGTTKKRPRNTSSSSSAKRRCDSIDSRPLDLSIRSEVRGSTPTHVADDEEARNRTNRTHACDCGVSFYLASILESHQKYYCKNRVIDETERQEPPKKIPSRCSQCDYVPATSAQLNQHIRHKHSAVQSLVCLICGYKGYSTRGIKNHLRTSHINEMQKRRTENPSILLSDRSLLEDYVFCVTADTKQYTCLTCRSKFPTTTLLQNHHCSNETQQKTVQVTDDNSVPSPTSANERLSVNNEVTTSPRNSIDVPVEVVKLVEPKIEVD